MSTLLLSFVIAFLAVCPPLIFADVSILIASGLSVLLFVVPKLNFLWIGAWGYGIYHMFSHHHAQWEYYAFFGLFALYIILYVFRIVKTYKQLKQFQE